MCESCLSYDTNHSLSHTHARTHTLIYPSMISSTRSFAYTLPPSPIQTLIDMAADRGAFIDQSQSFSVFIAEPTYPKLTSMHFYAWKAGLKTGMYYLRTRPAAKAIQFTVDQQKLEEVSRVRAWAEERGTAALTNLPSVIPRPH